MSIVSLRYARALESVAAEQHLDRSAISRQLDDLAGTLQESRELRNFLENPSLPTPDKLRVLDAVSARVGLDKTVRNFTAVLMDHGRMESIDEIIAEYRLLADNSAKVAEVEVISAKPLAQAERDLLQWKSGELAGSAVRVTWTEDPSLLGGAIIRLGSRVFDGSVRGELNKMHRHLTGAA